MAPFEFFGVEPLIKLRLSFGVVNGIENGFRTFRNRRTRTKDAGSAGFFEVGVVFLRDHATYNHKNIVCTLLLQGFDQCGYQCFVTSRLG